MELVAAAGMTVAAVAEDHYQQKEEEQKAGIDAFTAVMEETTIRHIEITCFLKNDLLQDMQQIIFVCAARSLLRPRMKRPRQILHSAGPSCISLLYRF
ncbi:MAG: hypothetical protein IJC68_03970, partial [Firmicutes bacterium]|nr:hypothetical protein [Bacillota bacterium]